MIAEVALVALVAGVQIGFTTLAGEHQPEARSMDALGVLLLALAAASLPFRWRWPVGALAVSFSATLLYWSLGFPRGPVFLSLAIAFVSALLRGHRRAAITFLVLGFVGFNWLGAWLGTFDAPPWFAVAAVAGWLIALYSIAEVVRARHQSRWARMQAREEEWQRRTTDERLRIARDVHDLVAHHMSLINVQAGVGRHLIDRDPEVARQALDTIKESSKQALIELRGIVGVLRQVDEDAPRAPTPGLARLSDLVANAAAAGVEVRVEVDGSIDALPRATDLAAYRIIQESLTNVVRHSDRPEAVVRIHRDGDELDVEVLDEGSGRPATPDLPSGGSGIPGMRERAAAVGGSLDAGPRPGRGFAVRARLPIGAAS